MILGVGVDVCEVRRLRRALARPGFSKRVFRPSEARYCDGRARPERHYAARFAAKEALFKALGTGWGGRVGWTDVAVERAPGGRPALRLAGAAARASRALGVRRAHLSLSHGDEYAVAVVVLEGTRPRGAGSGSGRR
ncbi:MAG: holo-ACP synthase [Acidobacteriota bacterium]